MSSDLELLDGAIPLVRNDQPWEWFVNFYDDPEAADPTDLTGHTASAQIRWRAGSQDVTAEITNPLTGQVRLSLLASQTAAMPLGRLSKLYIAIDTDTEAVVPVDVIEGLFGVTEPVEPPPEETLPVHVVMPASGDVVVLTDGRPVYVDAGTLAALTIRLPLGAAAPLEIAISFRSPVTALGIQDGGGVPVPGSATNAYGPGSAQVYEYVDDTRRWVYWQ
jgi:hypothetical protein